MGMFDYFIPMPPIECPFCGSHMTGWQGKPWNGRALFVWKQGHVSPVDQRTDDDCRIPAAKLASQRLESAEIPIYGGLCESCGRSWLDSAFGVSADARAGIWSQTTFDPPPLAAYELMPELLQCSGCADPIDVQPRQKLAYCDTCRRLVERKPSASSSPGSA